MPDYEKIAESVQMPDGAPAVEIPAEQSATTVREYLPVSHPRYQGLAEEKGYDQSHGRIIATRYTHEAMIDVVIAQPGIKQNELAKMFDRSVPWISRIIGSDAFQAALAKRREEITDPFLIATVEERMKGLALQSLDIISEKLDLSKNADLALKALDISAKSLGFGARATGPGQHNSFTIVLPPKAANSEEWVQSHSPMKQIESS